jgi:hypothetical protein
MSQNNQKEFAFIFVCIWLRLQHIRRRWSNSKMQHLSLCYISVTVLEDIKITFMILFISMVFLMNKTFI